MKLEMIRKESFASSQKVRNTRTFKRKRVSFCVNRSLLAVSTDLWISAVNLVNSSLSFS